MSYRVLLITATFIFFTTETQSQQEITRLEPRIAVERELAGGQKHIYQFPLNAGQYANVIVSQRGLDAMVRLIGTDGKLIAEFDSDFRLKGEETVEMMAETAGDYKIEVESKTKPDSTGRYEIRLAELRTATDQDRSLDEANQLIRQSNLLFSQSKNKEAQPLAERALAIRRDLLGPDQLPVANALHALAAITYAMEDFEKAGTLFEQELAIREKLQPPDHPDLAESMRGLAGAYHMQGKYSKATELYTRALEIKEQAFGPDHPEVGSLVSTIAKHYNYIRDNVHSQLFFERALVIAEKSFGTNNPTYAKALSSLATVYKDQADYGEAKLMFQQALEILEKFYGPEEPKIVPVLINYGILYLDIGEYEKAESLFQRTLKLLEKVEKDDFALTIVLSNLGRTYLGEREYPKAEAVFQRALTIRENMFGMEHPRTAMAFRDLADLYRDEGDYTKAEDFYRRALEIFEKAYGPEHPDVVAPLQELSVLARAKGDITQSVALQTRVNAVTERNLTYNLILGSERQKLLYLGSLTDQTDCTLSLHINSASDDPDAETLAENTVLQRKGRVLDWMSDNLATLRNRFSATDRREIDQLNETNSQLANLVLNGPQKMPVAEHQKRIQTLEEEREKLEKEISKRSSGFYQPQNPIDVSALQAVIPSSAALIEFAIYRPFDPKADEKNAFGNPRYVAYVIRNKGLSWKELGDVKKIDASINAFREALRNYWRKDVKQLARMVDQKIMQPIRPLLGDATHLFISPDGELNLIPFDALVDEHNHYLIERFSCTYLSSGRDLLRLQIARNSKTDPVVFADPMFGEPAPVLIAKGTDRNHSVNAKRESVTSASDMSKIYFAPLAGTASEAQAIKSLFNRAKVLIGKQATESSLKQVNAPRILHIATHGFFLIDAPTSEMNAHNRAINANVKIENPLLRSGLAFAGANLHNSKGDDGILTALEASGLNLWGTKLVTLSACDTGLGEIKNGEGVYGLRRAFIFAGTETLVMTLWGVNDYVTREMMTNYYKGLKKGLGRGEALRQVQLGMLKDKQKQHPYYWASFIQSGEWANLQGQR